ncbi:uncharacterized protein L969DRAFT_105982 [Mixia osmundae IAM 14324]|uniref:Protein yippee-like n=1 Tax=Mixia osmundae (strain CBS 9802 / IAM 14324 / JCM 22182 / KY 12970) TaxID=764103 RepID=G7DV45_MIXOS|nr:uncharacterized protein L969DRAFT_105982 [Mixia osmundae IAM 14324]KEI36328.1 hypothetical protein L969DRAFT_105982 [Mixia osmundae IAM 14324]GAA94455.1 hypothetical protein E5Q_01107 [Mixia osmundae IAM 14324]
MGRAIATFLVASRVYGCAKCHAHLATVETMISRQFTGQHGRAFLFDQVFNIDLGPAEDRTMTTGLHTVRDIYCARCGTTLGWKYDKAFEQAQKYKEGRFILEKMLLCDQPPLPKDESLEILPAERVPPRSTANAVHL